MEDKEKKLNNGRSILQDRRQFLGVFASLAGVIGAIEFTYPLLKSFTPVQRGEAEPVIVPLDDIPIGSTKPVIYGGNPSLILNHKEGIVAVSLVCTHLGCIVKWDSQRELFQCPCHEGFFDKTGKVISGPPPAPLEQLTIKVAGDKVIVGIT